MMMQSQMQRFRSHNNKFNIKSYRNFTTCKWWYRCDFFVWCKYSSINASANFSDNIVQRATLKDTSETVVALGDLGGGTDDLDLSAGNVFTATVSTGTQNTFSNPSASGTCYCFMLILTNSGSQTVNFPNTVTGGTAPSLTASGTDILMFTTVDGGTIFHCIVASTDSKTQVSRGGVQESFIQRWCGQARVYFGDGSR